ncbi:MAG TPA: hypothetical protein VFN70_18235 [Burkholderiales bacterium]|nr:hypothetical protein [Burkholderiales bacterium]
MISPVIVITHAAFDESRRASLKRLLTQLHDDTVEGGLCFEIIVQRDEERRGSFWCWHEAMIRGFEFDFRSATHIVSLPDDAIICKGFQRALLAAIEARPDDVLECFDDDLVTAPNYPDGGWYSTHDGFHGLGGVFPRALLEEHLAWRAKNLDPDVANDLGVNFWAMATRRLIWKTSPALVDHDESIPSLDGNADQGVRRPKHFAEDGAALSFPRGYGINDEGRTVHRGRVRKGNHWELIFRSMPSSWDLEASYWAERNGEYLPEFTKHVFIAIPAYQAPEPAMRTSLRATVADLEAHAIKVTVLETGGDSLVTRGRHVLVHEFLCSTATHLLQWDADIECLDATAVRKMLETGHDLIGGAYPFRDGSGHVVANPLAEDLRDGKVTVDAEAGTIRVGEVGTGFMLTSRKLLIDLQQRHPELLYQSDLFSHREAPMWALFDVALEVGEDGRKRYASEDWHFCSLARAAGYSVYVYAPPKFRHWGKAGHEGHVLHAWGMVPKDGAT